MEHGRSQRKPKLAILLACCITLASCGQNGTEVAASPEYGDAVNDWYETDPANIPEGFEEVDWTGLQPADYSGEDVYVQYADELEAVQDGSPEAEALYERIQLEVAEEGDKLNESLDGKKVYMAGFASPFNYEDEVVTEFLLVPYFGACIHVPAPPANQTVMVTLDEANGLNIQDTWGAIWVTGTLSANPVETDLATAGYTLTGVDSGSQEAS